MKARKALDRQTAEAMGRLLREKRSELAQALQNAVPEPPAGMPAPTPTHPGGPRPGTWVADVHTALVSRQTRKLAEVESALSRLDRGEYGLCEDCGGVIGLGRLRVLPFAARCGRCQTRADFRLHRATRAVVGRIGNGQPARRRRSLSV